VIAALAAAALIIAEALALFVVAAFVGAGFESDEKHAVSAVTLVALGLIAFVLPRALAGFDLSRRARGAIAGGVSFVAIYGALRLEFAGDFALWDFAWAGDFLENASAVTRAGSDALVGAFFVVGIWVWGLVRSAREEDLEFFPRTLGMSFLVVTLFVILGAGTSAAGQVAWGGAAFYAVAVVALALSQSARSGATIGTLRTGGVTAALLGGTVAAALAGLVLFGLIWGPLQGPAGWFIDNVVGTILVVALTPLLWALEHVMRFLFGGDNPFANLRLESQELVREVGREEAEEDRSTASQFFAYGLRLFGIVLVLAVTVGLVAFFTRFRKSSGTSAEAPDSVAGAGSLADDARALFRSLFRRRPERPVGASEGVVRLYREVLERADERGHSRPPGSTADEFAPELAETFQSPVTDEITRAFDEARYAGRPPDERALRDLQERWRLVN
jgi:hypothetical protein